MVHTLARLTFVLSLTFLALPALAQAPAARPSPEAVKATWDYYYGGQGQGPVLVEARLCLEVGREGAQKYECLKEVPADGVKAGTPVMLWQSYLLPQGEQVDDLVVQVKLGGTVRETKDVVLKGEGWRARQWTGVRFTKAGSWSVSVLRGEQVLRTLEVRVF